MVRRRILLSDSPSISSLLITREVPEASGEQIIVTETESGDGSQTAPLSLYDCMNEPHLIVVAKLR